jgi:hypothetical protein
MNPTKKLAMTVPVMRETLMMWCHHLTVLHLLATQEHDDTPATREVIKHVEETHTKVKDMCNAYDKLRSLVGMLEEESCLEIRRFYPDDCAGCVEKGHCPNLKH